ncbi:oocyte zinc finger protein XlCOF19-like [Sinocyclocheilus anshuiensis]|uniref:oocyte zinc finger protein XlCOF19-like n=1 Tax=Sinocyclocheilus anshuiensis TaxID=1608454 RepID=UPI0007BA73A6|nr:PREDICTED: oocyte zinc finger protein XlCOF19-like [Sinocyclocheilus anshuiensis]
MENPEAPRLNVETVNEMHNEAEVKPNYVAKLLQDHSEYTCSVCGVSTFSLARMNKHMQSHDRDRPFPCELCGKRFGCRSHHTEHQRVHTGARPYTCDRCEWAFTTRHNLKRHQLVHDKEETYSCNVCGLLFCQEHQMRSIMRVHHEQRGSQIHPKLKNKTNQNMDQKKKIHKSLKKLGRDAFERLNTRIQRIAYDIEVVL